MKREDIEKILKEHSEPLQIGNVPYVFVIHSGLFSIIAEKLASPVQPLQEEEGQLYVWDATNSGLEDVKDFEEAKKFIHECYSDSTDGIHPDIESVMILRQVGGVSITETGEKAELYGEEVPVCKIDIYLTHQNPKQ